MGAKPTDPTSKPCHRLQYTGVFTGIYEALTSMNRIEYTIYFKDPPMMTVKEEYLIYDYVGLISSVGGTLGICVGISFYGISEDIVGCMVAGVRILRSKKEKRKREKAKRRREKRNKSQTKISKTKHTLKIRGKS